MPGLYTGATGLWGGFAGLLYGTSGLSTPPGLLADAGWSPLALFSGGAEGAWYDPSDFSTMFQDAAGTVPVTAVGNPVGRILDKSGRGNHASQSTPTARPVLGQDGAGRYYLSFDGVDDFLVTGNVNFSATDKMSIFSGFTKLSDATTSKTLLGLSINPISTLSTFIVNTTQTIGSGIYGWRIRGDSTATGLPAAGFSSPITSVLTCLGDISGSLRTMRVNAIQRATSSLAIGTGNLISAPLFIGSIGGGSSFFNGYVYSLIAVGSLASSSQIVETETWVNAKTGAY